MFEFTNVLLELNEGRTDKELAEKLTEVVAAVKHTGKAGEVSLTVKVKPASKGGSDVVFLVDEIKVKVPQFDRAATVFFVDDHNQLKRENPRQMKIPAMDEGGQ